MRNFNLWEACSAWLGDTTGFAAIVAHAIELDDWKEFLASQTHVERSMLDQWARGENLPDSTKQRHLVEEIRRISKPRKNKSNILDSVQLGDNPEKMWNEMARADDATLWSILRTEPPAPEYDGQITEGLVRRIYALAELSKRDADASEPLLAFLLTEIQRRPSDDLWCEALIDTISDIKSTQAAERKQIARWLFEQIVSQAEHPSKHIFSTIVCWATLVPVAELADLKVLLEPKQEMVVKQAALQAVQGFFPASERSKWPSDFVSRIHELASTFLNPDVLCSAQNAAFAMNAYIATVLLGEDLPSLGGQFERCPDWFKQLTQRQLANLRDWGDA